MNEYTLGEVREAAVRWLSDTGRGAKDSDRVRAGLAIDRALAAHDAEVASKAWAEGAQWAAVECGVIREKANGWVTDADNPHIVP